jgi:sugar phosphate isomerase/epimerase
MNRRQFLLSAAAAAIRPLHAAFPAPSAIGANTAITGYSLAQAVDTIRELGFPAIEFHTMGVPEAVPGKFPGLQFDRIGPDVKRRVRESLAGFGTVTAHLPYAGLDYFARDAAASAASQRQVETAIECAAYFGATLAVVHPMVPTGYGEDEGWQVMVRTLRHWGGLAEQHKLRLAIETGYPHSIRRYVQLVREVDHAWVGATIDVGHQAQYAELLARVKPEDRGTPAGIRAYNDTTIAIIQQLGKKVFHLHVHDIDPPTWKEHVPLGTGFVDYPRLVGKLKEVGYSGLLMLEIGAPADQMRRHLGDAKRKLEDYLKGA